MRKILVAFMLLFLGSALSADKLLLAVTKGKSADTEVFTINVGEASYNPFQRDGMNLEVIVKSVDKKTGNVSCNIIYQEEVVDGDVTHKAKFDLDYKTSGTKKVTLIKSYLNQNAIVISAQLVK